jgi:hypothetical protein
MWSEADKNWLKEVIAKRQARLTFCNLDYHETQIESLTAKLVEAKIMNSDHLKSEVSKSRNYYKLMTKMTKAGIHMEVANQIFLGVEY